MTIQELKNHIYPRLHTGTLNKVRNFYHAIERASSNVRSNIKPVSLERTTGLTSLIYDDVYNYALPSDFGNLIDLYPQDTRQLGDLASRKFMQPFDLKKALAQKTISIEGSEGSRFIRINWRTHAPIVIDSMNATTGWSAVGTASNISSQTLYKISGNASVEFDVAVTGDGIQKTTLSNLDLTDQDEIADEFAWVHIPTSADLAKFTSATTRWGNDLTANYWESSASTTQADGSAFQVGWNLLKFAWSGATETGTVDPSEIDSTRIVFAITGAITNLRVDSLVFAVGRNFDVKYYSQYGFKNTAGTYIIRPTTDDDSVVYEGTALSCFIEEVIKECSAQIQGVDSTFDITFANKRLFGDNSSPDPMMRVGLYAKYRVEYPSNVQRAVRNWNTPKNPNIR